MLLNIGGTNLSTGNEHDKEASVKSEFGVEFGLCHCFCITELFLAKVTVLEATYIRPVDSCCEVNRRTALLLMEDFDVEERKDAAANALTNYSQFVTACIGEGVSASQLRLHLMKEISGMPTTLTNPKCDKEKGASSSDNSGKADVVMLTPKN